MKRSRFPIHHLVRVWRVLLVCSGAGCLDLAVAAEGGPEHRLEFPSLRDSVVPRLGLTGGTPAALWKYFDLFSLEVSSDLRTWRPLATVLRTNVTNTVFYSDVDAGAESARFYRTATNASNTPFPAPTGPFSVGTVVRQSGDPTRTNRFGIPTNSAFMLTMWYPAERRAGSLPAPYMHPLLAARRAYWGAATNALPWLHSHALAAPPVATDGGRFPVVLYSHGLGDYSGVAVRTENTQAAVELASHGYVVVSMDHHETYGTVLESDQLMLGRRTFSFDSMDERIKDVAWLLDQVTAWDGTDPMLQGRLDLERIGIMGWSFGGGTAAESGRLHGRLKAVVLLDGYLGSTPEVLNSGMKKPFLSMNSGELLTENTTLFNRATRDAYLLTIKGATHDRFTDSAWIVGPTAANRSQAKAINACMVAFFEKHLRGIDNHLLDAPATTYPEIGIFKKK